MEDVGGVAVIDHVDVTTGVNDLGRLLGGGHGALLRRRPWGAVKRPWRDWTGQDWTTQAIGQQHTSPLRAGCEARRREIVLIFGCGNGLARDGPGASKEGGIISATRSRRAEEAGIRK